MQLTPSSSSVNETLQHDADTLAPLAKKLGFSFEAFGTTYGNKTERHISLSTKAESPLEPAPISPAESKAFELMAATARHIFGAKIVTSPTGMYGE
jgi:Gly-Xaa carboxypeptidase